VKLTAGRKMIAAVRLSLPATESAEASGRSARDALSSCGGEGRGEEGRVDASWNISAPLQVAEAKISSHPRVCPRRPPPSPGPLSPKRRERIAEDGFSLIEVVAVMLIIAMVAGLAVAFTRGTGRAQLKAVALEAAALLRRERLGAILTGRDRRVSLDGERRQLVGDGGGIVGIPGDVAVDIIGIDAQWSGRRAVVGFHPDGASSGTVLKLSRQGAEYEIRVNWYTGSVAVEGR
jgi:general secretion pathway protein H